MAQNLFASPTGDPQRAHVGPEAGAVRRRPQWGQNGWDAVADAPQNGQGTASPGFGTTGARATTRVLWPGAASAAIALSPLDLAMGFPQSMQ